MFGFDVSIPPATWVGSEDEAKKWCEYFVYAAAKESGLGLDTETTGLDKNRDVVVVWSLSDGKYRLCLPAKFLRIFKEPLLENPKVNFDLSNAKFDMHMLANTGIDISKAGEIRDTIIQSWLLNENNQGRHGLKETTKEHLGRETPHFETVFGKIPPQRVDKATGRVLSKTVADLVYEGFAPYFTPEKVPELALEMAKEEWKKKDGEEVLQILVKQKTKFIEDRFIKAVDYAALDAYNSTMLRRHFDSLLAKQPYDLRQYFYRIEVPFTKTLWKMERRGVTIDLGHLQEQEKPIREEMKRIEREFAREAGEPMNLNSPESIRQFFYERLKKPVVKMTKGGATGIQKPSTDESVLTKWAEEGDPWAQKMVTYRGMSKILGTYIEGLKERVDQNCRIHTNLNQHGTVTGRLSSSDPNLQNIPRASEDKFKIREAFIPGHKKTLIVADYAQLEMRLMAHFCKDEKMINAIREGIDLHCLSVSEMYGIPYDEVIDAVGAEKKHKKGKLGRELTDREKELLFLRQGCKSTGFGIIYGIAGKRLAIQLTAMGERVVTEEEGYQLIDKWYGIFPGVRAYVDHVHSVLKSKGYVQTLSGRFRRFGDVRGMSYKDRGQAERQGVNSIIQGTAADLAKVSMILAESDEVLNQLGAQLLLQIHDELIWECPDDPETVAKVKARVQEIMEAPFQNPLEVPIPAEAGHGYSWATAK